MAILRDTPIRFIFLFGYVLSKFITFVVIPLLLFLTSTPLFNKYNIHLLYITIFIKI